MGNRFPIPLTLAKQKLIEFITNLVKNYKAMPVKTNIDIDVPVKVTGIAEPEGGIIWVTFDPVTKSDDTERQMADSFKLAFTEADPILATLEIDGEYSFVGPRPRKPHP